MMEEALKKSTEVKDQKIVLLENKLKEAQERQQVRGAANRVFAGDKFVSSKGNSLRT